MVQVRSNGGQTARVQLRRAFWQGGWRLVELAADALARPAGRTAHAAEAGPHGLSGSLAVPEDEAAAAPSCAVTVVLLPPGVRREAATEASGSLVLRLVDARGAAELRRAVARSAALMESVAGTAGQGALVPQVCGGPAARLCSCAAERVPCPAGVLGDEPPALDAADGAAGGDAPDWLDALLRNRELLALTGRLPALQLHLAGRRPRNWRAIREAVHGPLSPVQRPGAVGAGGGVGEAGLSGSMYAPPPPSESLAATDPCLTAGGPPGRAPSSSFLSNQAFSAAQPGSAADVALAMPRPPSPAAGPRSWAPGSVSSRASGGPALTSMGSDALAAATAAGKSVPSSGPGGGEGESDDDALFEDAAEAGDEEGEEEGAQRAVGHTALELTRHGLHGGEGGAPGEMALGQEGALLVLTLSAAELDLRYSAQRLAADVRMQVSRPSHPEPGGGRLLHSAP